jgi:hypothetical protein
MTIRCLGLHKSFLGSFDKFGRRSIHSHRAKKGQDNDEGSHKDWNRGYKWHGFRIWGIGIPSATSAAACLAMSSFSASSCEASKDKSSIVLAWGQVRKTTSVSFTLPDSVQL